MPVDDLAQVRQKAAREKKADDRDFLKFCEAVGILAGLQRRGRNAATYARMLDMGLDLETGIAEARDFLNAALRP